MSLTNDEIITHGPLWHCLSFFTVKLDPFTSPSCHYKSRKKKNSKTIHTSRQCASLRINDVNVGNNCHGVFQKIGTDSFHLVQKVLVAFCDVTTLWGLRRMSMQLCSSFKFQKQFRSLKGILSCLSAPFSQTPATFAPGCRGLCNMKQGKRICLFSGYCVSFNRPGNSWC